ncbi:Aminopeptidase 2 mitochondrial [Rhodotorula kratochvilovae]
MAAVPLAYRLTVKTSFPASFTGVVEIVLDLPAPTQSLTLNAAAPLKLLSGVLVTSKKRVPVEDVVLNEADELATLNLAEAVPAGRATLALRWEGRLDESGLQGYYRVACPPVEGESLEHYAVTQFQPTSARRAFPCFDHPAKKATFSVSLLSPAGFTSLSNTPEASRATSAGAFKPSDVCTKAFLAGEEGKLADETAVTDCATSEWELVTFKEMPPMSTYLACWAVGRSDSVASSYTSPITGEVVPLAAYASKAFQHIERGQAQRALDTLANVMPVYEKMFDLPYELGKLDLLVVDDFEAGAMENFGLITGRKSTLLYDEKTGGDGALRQVVTTVSHEAAHMWFGNSTTLSWWDDLWLNESFATLIGEVVAINVIEPSWNVHSSFIKYHRSDALRVDALRSSHPIHLACKHESEVPQTFDHISYEKGSAVLKMLMEVIGEDRFLAGTAAYLKEHKYACATSKDLWRALSAASEVDVEQLMESWVEKIGFPVITVEEDGDQLKLRQNRFLSTGDPNPEEDETLWTVPLFVKDAASAAAPKVVLMSTREIVIPKPGELYFLNAESRSTIRVAYPASHISKLAAAASKPDSGLSLTDRVGLVEDLLLLSEAGYTSTLPALDFLSTFAPTETEFLVWAEIAGAFKRLADAWWEQPKEELDALRAFARKLFRPMVDSLGLQHRPDDDPEMRRFRALVVAAAAAVEDPDLLAWVQQAFAGFLAGEVDPLAADLAPFVVATAVQHGGTAEYETALAIYRSAPTPQHQMAAILGLASTRDAELVQRTVAMMSGGEAKAEELPVFLHGLAANPSARRLVWQLLQHAWPMLEAQFRGSMLLGKIAATSFESFSAEEDAAAVEAFFADKDTTAYKQPLQQGLDTVRSKARWLAREKDAVRGWLEKEGYLAVGEAEGEAKRDSGFAQ